MPTPYVLVRDHPDTDGPCDHVTADLTAKDLITRVLPGLLGQHPQPDAVAFLVLAGSAVTACGLVPLPDPAHARHRLGTDLGDDVAVTLPLLDAGPLWNPPPADDAAMVIVGYGARDREPDLRRIAELIPLPVRRILRVHGGRWWRLDCPGLTGHTNPACTPFGAQLRRQ